MTLKTILVATDFSDSAQAALEHGRGLAAAFNASLHLLHVVTEPLQEVWAGYAPGAALVDILEDQQAHARTCLARLVPEGDVATGSVTVATAWGDPSDEICKYARDHGIDLVVCGTHGHRGWNRLLMGSVAESVVRLAPCPVFTVHAADAVRAAA
jgi:nucleotide-binding universal stress UspA family protein